MRTKTLLLTAALGAAGVASTLGQAVYSVNAVGYVNTTLGPGFTLVSNPLDAGAGNNIVSKLFSNITPSVPQALTVYTFGPSNPADPNSAPKFFNASYDDLEATFIGDAADDVVNPGDGAFVLNPTQQTLTVTFVGEVPQGNLSNPLPAGFSIQSSQVPQAGRVTSDLGLVGQQGDTIYKFNTTAQRYNNWSFDDLENNWINGQGQVEEPSLAVGEAFFLLKRNAANWTRQFSVNP